MDANVTLSNVSTREAAMADIVLSEINQQRQDSNLPVFTSILEYAEDLVVSNLESLIQSEELKKANIREQLWIQADDTVRAAVDTALGYTGT